MAHHDHHAMEDHMSGNHDMNMHAMFFHFGSKETILFGFWNVSSPVGIIISCFFVFGGCVLLEGIRWFRMHRNYAQAANNLVAENSSRRQLDAYLLVDTLLHATQLFLSYLAMLVFMTFNVWLCLAIIAGESLSFLAFRVFLPHLENAALSTSTQPCCG